MFDRSGAGSGARDAARSDVAIDQPQGAGVDQVRGLLERGVPEATAIADVIRANPVDERAIFTLLHGTMGNAYVQQVFAALPAGAQAKAPHVASNPAVAEAAKDELNVVIKVLVYSGKRVVKRWQAQGHWEGPLPVTFRAEHGKSGWVWDDKHGKQVRINTSRGREDGQPIESWAGNGDRIVVYAQPIGSVDVDLAAENDERAPGLAKDKKDAGDGSTTEVKPGDGTKAGAAETKKPGSDAKATDATSDSTRVKADDVGDGTDADGHGAGEVAGEGEEDEGSADEAERELGEEVDGDEDDGKTTGKESGGEKVGGRGDIGGDKDKKNIGTDATIGGEGPGGADAKAGGIEDGQKNAKDNSGTASGSNRGEKWGSEEGEFGGEGGHEDRGARGAMALLGGILSVPGPLRGLVELAMIWSGGDLTGAGAAAFRKGVGKAMSAAAVRRVLAKEAHTIAAKETRAIMKELAKNPAFKALSKAEKGQLAKATRWGLQRKYFEGYLKAAKQARREAKAALSRGSRAQRAAAKQREAAAAMAEEAATVKPVAGRLPINHKYAGKEFPRDALPPAYRSKGLKFKDTGYPDFSPYAKELPAGGKSVKIKLTGRMEDDEIAANITAGLDDTPTGWIWHHNEDLGVMELVPGDLHSVVRHTGGQAGFKNMTGIDYE